MSRRCRVLPGLLALALCTAALAAPGLKVDFYEVEGDDIHALRRALAERGPVGDDGVRYHGYTRWQVAWSYRLEHRGPRCVLQSHATRVEGRMTLPRWNPPQGAADGLMREWEAYSAALREHEDGHYAIGTAAAAEIRRRLGELRGTVGCEALEQAIGETAEAVLEEFRARERAYDRDTAHGARQGARL